MAPEQTWVIGDTPRDYECAAAVGAHCLLVATGRYSYQELTRLGADHVADDLKATVTVADLLTAGL